MAIGYPVSPLGPGASLGGNILVMDDGVIKLADFGASRKILELTGEPAQNHILGMPSGLAFRGLGRRPRPRGMTAAPEPIGTAAAAAAVAKEMTAEFFGGQTGRPSQIPGSHSQVSVGPIGVGAFPEAIPH